MKLSIKKRKRKEIPYEGDLYELCHNYVANS